MENNDLHIHQFEEILVPPTCQESGYTLYKCACGYERKSNFKPMGNHDFQPVETTPATCTEPGSRTLVCTACGIERREDIPPLEHTYGNWVIQDYPTCTEPGKKLRRCSGCNAVEEQEIPATGHKCVPGTIRCVDGNAVDYFCENCGQTVACPEDFLEEPLLPKRHIPTRILSALTAFVAFLSVIFMILFDLQEGVSISYVGYTQPFVIIASCILFAIFAGKIKDSDRYTKLVGVATLVYAGYESFFRLINIINAFKYGWAYGPWLASWLLGTIPIVFLVLLTLFFFAGAKKKNWLFIVLLVFVVLQGLSYITDIAQYARYGVYHFLYFYCTGITHTLFWFCLTMLCQPPKRKKQMLS